MTREDFLEFCRTIGGAEADQPFGEDFSSWVVRHENNRKWFALLMEHDGKDIVNLKCDPQEADFLRSVFKGVVPAYHMNKTHWNTVYLVSDVPDEEIRRMVMSSFHLTEKKTRRKPQANTEEK